MSAKIIIYITGKPLLHGYKRREFQWSPAHGHYLYEARELELSEFNSKYEKALRTNSDLRVLVKVVGAVAAEPVEAPAEGGADEPNIAGITADRAEEVLMQLRPERLKKTPGRKPAVLEVA